MFRTALKVLAADVLLLVAEFYVIQDLNWREAYAALPKAVCPQTCTYAPSFSYGFLTQFFTMSGGPLQLVSPPTLDWVQTLAIVLVVVNGWFAYHALKGRARKGTVGGVPADPAA